MNVKKVMTFKSGKFVFSQKISESVIQPLDIEIRIIYNSLKELPILPSLSCQFETELIRRSIYSTAAIEGNPLQEDEVGEILDNFPQENITETKNIEIYNLKKVYDQISTISATSNFKLSEDFIKNVHQTVTDRLSIDFCMPGYYRNHIVKVGDKQHGGVDTPPKCLKDIRILMAEYVEWFNSPNIQTLTPVVRSALGHYYLALIHPFGDGNGRIARIVEAAILKASGIKYLPTMLSNYYYRNMDEYFVAISQSRKSKEFDITPFLKFVLTGAIKSLNEVKDRVTFYIRKAALRDYFQNLRAEKKITKRQLELLNLLLESSEDTVITVNSIQKILPFKVLYSTVSARTARRDLTKLYELGILEAVEKGFKLDNSLKEDCFIKEITVKTTTEDFRRKPLHRCWCLAKQEEVLEACH